jgi:hypothetical protein
MIKIILIIIYGLNIIISWILSLIIVNNYRRTIYSVSFIKLLLIFVAIPFIPIASIMTLYLGVKESIIDRNYIYHHNTSYRRNKHLKKLLK